MSSLSKGESMGIKLVELFANRVVERRLGGVDFRGSVDFEFFLLI
jgi:hypothetical protein